MKERRPPAHIHSAGVIGQPITYPWDTGESRKILWAAAEDYPSLAAAIMPISSRAGMALLAAVAEWVAWRYDGIIDISDALARIEATYVAAITPELVRMPMPDEPFPDDNGDAYGPLMLIRMLMSMGIDDARQDERVVLSRVFSAVLLARHVLSKPEVFERWLADVLRRANADYPATEVPPEQQPPIGPKFFLVGGEEALVPSERGADGLALQAAANRYLHPPTGASQ